MALYNARKFACTFEACFLEEVDSWIIRSISEVGRYNPVAKDPKEKSSDPGNTEREIRFRRVTVSSRSRISPCVGRMNRSKSWISCCRMHIHTD